MNGLLNLSYLFTSLTGGLDEKQPLIMLNLFQEA